MNRIIGLVIILTIIILFFVTGKKYTILEQTLEGDYLESKDVIKKIPMLYEARDTLYKMHAKDKSMDILISADTPRKIVITLLDLKKTKLQSDPHFSVFENKVNKLLLI
jgi:hypothetical protein